MPVTVTKHFIVGDGRGGVISDTPYEEDVTVESVTFDLATKARAAIARNTTFAGQAKPGTAAAQASAAYDAAVTLAKENTAIIKLLMGLLPALNGADLLLDNSGT